MSKGYLKKLGWPKTSPKGDLKPKRRQGELGSPQKDFKRPRLTLNKRRGCITKSEIGEDSNLAPKSTRGNWARARCQFLQNQGGK